MNNFKSTKQISQTKSVVLVGGCFDFIHYGHVEFLCSAKKLGNKLVVALESDENVRRMKGPSRPIHNQRQRRQMLLSLRCVDEVINLPPMNSDKEYFDLVETVKPEIIAATEGDPMLTKKRTHAARVGAEVILIPKIMTPSTSQLSKLLGLE